jgi:hypothetical protein
LNRLPVPGHAKYRWDGESARENAPNRHSAEEIRRGTGARDDGAAAPAADADRRDREGSHAEGQGRRGEVSGLVEQIDEDRRQRGDREHGKRARAVPLFVALVDRVHAVPRAYYQRGGAVP